MGCPRNGVAPGRRSVTTRLAVRVHTLTVNFSHADADPSLEAGLPIAAALEQQFGMKLVKRNAKVDYFVIEHVQKPSEN